MKNRAILLFAAILMGILAACTQAEVTDAPTGPFNIDEYIGVYTGTWENQTSGAGGAARIEITADKAARTATLTIDFDGPYLGLIDPPAATIAGVYDDQMALVDGEDFLFGKYHVTIDAEGNIVGVMTGLAGGTVPEMTYTGVVGGGRLDADYTITLADGKVATAILRMEKED